MRFWFLQQCLECLAAKRGKGNAVALELKPSSRSIWSSVLVLQRQRWINYFIICNILFLDTWFLNRCKFSTFPLIVTNIWTEAGNKFKLFCERIQQVFRRRSKSFLLNFYGPQDISRLTYFSDFEYRTQRSHRPQLDSIWTHIALQRQAESVRRVVFSPHYTPTE